MDDHMTFVKPLPKDLQQRYLTWKTTEYAEKQRLLEDLVDNGQKPRAMVISCCDSRVHVTSIFGAEQGDFFIHRNIANVIPPFAPDGLNHGTSAAIEYAVSVLEVKELIVLGHSQCGGVKACDDYCSNGSDIKENTQFIGNWIGILEPAHKRVAHIKDEEERTTALEKENVKQSLSNVMEFPFVHAAVDAGTLNLHGLWHDIRSGDVEYYDADTDAFKAI